ncbi:MAG TPA: LysR family transcriptional regulator [Burkholderiaceae bacterium]|nr:LysR family transcriptional regulator [Burkholderiaceae bacterium]
MAFDGRQLNAFLAVVTHGSLGRAAQALHLTQPALSRTIRRLELQIGAPLFDRQTKGMSLTAIGEALLPHARLLQHQADIADEEIQALRGLAKGTIRVGAIGSAASGVLPLALARTLECWPNLRAYVVEGVSDRLSHALANHEIDLALDVVRPTDDDDPEVCAIADCQWEDRSSIVAASAHPLRRRPGLKLADTLAEKWAVPPRGTEPFDHLQQVLRAHGLPLPNVVIETRSITMLKSLIVHAGFLCWMAEPICEAERAAGSIDALPLPELVAPRRLTVFRRRHGMLPAPAAKLVEQLRRVRPHLSAAPAPELVRGTRHLAALAHAGVEAG